MRQVADHLWIGNALEARDIRAVLDSGTKAVVDVAVEERPLQPTRELIVCRIPLHDGKGNLGASLQLAIRTVAELFRQSVPTLLACSAGMSRSPTIAAAAITLARCADPLSRDDYFVRTLVDIAQTGPCDASPALLKDVQLALRTMSLECRGESDG